MTTDANNISKFGGDCWKRISVKVQKNGKKTSFFLWSGVDYQQLVIEILYIKTKKKKKMKSSQWSCIQRNILKFHGFSWKRFSVET